VPALVCFSEVTWKVLAGFSRKAPDERFGTICVSSSRPFPSRSGAIDTNPLTFRPRRARLLTKPVPIGSPTATMTRRIESARCGLRPLKLHRVGRMRWMRQHCGSLQRGNELLL
jgi:hypothetical protein